MRTALSSEDWLLLLLLDSVLEPSESQPELEPDSCIAVGALPAALLDLAPPSSLLPSFLLHSSCLTMHDQLRLCSSEPYLPGPAVMSAPTSDIEAHLLCCPSSPNMHGLLDLT